MSPASTRLARASRSVARAYRSKRREEAQTDETDVEAVRARAIVALSMRAADMMLSSGSTAARATRLVLSICKHYGLPAQVDITYTRIMISYEPSAAGDPITVMRMVKSGSIDYDRLTRVESLIQAMTADALEIPVMFNRLRNIRREPRTYRAWVLHGAAAMMGGGIAMLLGGNRADVILSMLATITAEFIRSNMDRRGMNTFFTQVAAASGAAIVGLVAMTGRSLLPEGLQQASPGLVVAAGMVPLMAGLGIVTTAGDAIDAYYMSAGSRLVEVFVLTSGIVLGLIATLSMGLWLGVPSYLAPIEGFAATGLAQVVAAGIIAASFGVLCNMGPRSMLAATALGVTGQLVYMASAALTTSTPARSGLAAVGVGLVARLVTTPLRIPVVALISTGVAPLMPGLLLYRGIFGLVSDMPAGSGGIPTPGNDPQSLLLKCLMTGAALAVGSSFGAALGNTGLRLVTKGTVRRPIRANGDGSGFRRRRATPPAERSSIS
ncbi:MULTISPECIES: threonine/serine ThrE exporter family protein [unclassified Luteococcus]|uniref:threonine/serine ThrE exporter family protein n=1 Tax=unclassified Luteococcus TaxID=2639923 RepID=UPI00313B5121